MNQIRFLVTSHCNLNCGFCHMEGLEHKESRKLLPEDYQFIFRSVKKRYGFSSCTITGGEPLLRDDIDEIIKRLYDEGAKITLVTNGGKLKEHEDILRYITELHLSLHSLDKKLWLKATNGKEGDFQSVIDSLGCLQNKDLKISLNVCFLKGLTDSFTNFKKLYEFCRRNKYTLRIIETLENGGTYSFVPISTVKGWVENMGISNKYKPQRRKNRESVFEMTDGTTVGLIKYLCNYSFLYGKPQLNKNVRSLWIFLSHLTEKSKHASLLTIQFRYSMKSKKERR